MSSPRFLVGFSVANAILALPHILTATGGSYGLLSLGLAISRTIHGVVEFLAFVAAAGTGNESATDLFLMITIAGPFVAIGMERMWGEGPDSRALLVGAIVANMLFGGAAAWYGSVAAARVGECIASQSSGYVRVVEYEEIGWKGSYHYFAEWSADRAGRWESIDHRELQQPVPDSCSNLDAVFPSIGTMIEPLR